VFGAAGSLSLAASQAGRGVRGDRAGVPASRRGAPAHPIVQGTADVGVRPGNRPQVSCRRRPPDSPACHARNGPNPKERGGVSHRSGSGRSARAAITAGAAFGATLSGIGLLLFGVPWWTLFVSGARWPAAVVAAGTVLSLGTLLAFPALMVAGHGRRHLDWAARIGDTILGVLWILFAWAILANVLGVGLAIGGVTDPARSRIVAAAVAVVSLVLAVWGISRQRGFPAFAGWMSLSRGWVRASTASR